MAEIIPTWWGRAEAGSPYRPSNGTEGACFHEALCFKCERDKNEDCDILARTFAFNIGDKEYPAEWVHDDRGRPTCTAFWPFGEPLPRPRCTRTQDMFAASTPPP